MIHCATIVLLRCYLIKVLFSREIENITGGGMQDASPRQCYHFSGGAE